MISHAESDLIDRAMEKGVADNVFPGGVLLCAQGETIFYHKAFGRTDLTRGAPVTPDTVFDLASLTKPLATALAVAELIRTGQAELSTPLARVLPPVRGTAKASITLDMLLRHTSGLPAHREYYKMMSGPNPRQDLRRLILAEALEHPPGKKEVYSDLGYILLAWVVETLSGLRLDAFVRERIYGPLGIDALFFMDLATGRDLQCRVAATRDCPWRGKVIQGEVEDENAWAAGGIEGHAGLFGNALAVHTLCSALLAVLAGKSRWPLDPGVFRDFVIPLPGMTRVAGFDRVSARGSSAGRYFSSRTLGHLGFTGTSFWMDPCTGLIVILLTNRVHPSRRNLRIKNFRPRIHDLVASNFNGNIGV